MQIALLIIQMLSGVALIFLILSQTKGKGFSRSGGSSFTRRGLERLVFRSTFVVSAIFLISSIMQIFV